MQILLLGWGNGKVGRKGKVKSFEELFHAVTQAT